MKAYKRTPKSVIATLKSFQGLVISFAILLAACGGDNSSGSVSNAEQSGEAKIKDKSISGVSQKGPFVTGSKVELFELDDDYVQTGRSFKGKITSDDGKFSIPSVALVSHYALLEASGYFRSEATGKKSGGTITLNALTDLSDREKVNINLLTHLEYERALYLVGTGISVSAAKKQAETEIFKAFEIQGDFANSEDLDIFSKGEGNAALLAISVLMLDDRGCDDDPYCGQANLTELLSKFATDIEKDGKWDDEITKAKIADWAESLESWGELDEIRSNIEKWKLGDIPEFEKYVRHFWYTNYGLGECNKKREGEIMASKNEHSETYGTKIRFICKDGAWEEASDMDKDFYKSGKDKGTDGEIWTGPVSGEKYKYDEKSGRWFRIWWGDESPDIILNLACTGKREGSTAKDKEGNVYYCMENGYSFGVDDLDTVYEYSWWNLSNGWTSGVPKEVFLNPEIDYGTMTDSRDNKVYKTVKIGSQVWMAENLNYSDSIATPSLKGNSWCVWNESANCDVVGRLYTRTAAMNSVCPPGWHLPSQDEWINLFETVGGKSTADMALRSQTGWGSDNNGTDALGFSALPVGCNELTLVNETDEQGEAVSYYDCKPGYNDVAVFWSSTDGDFEVLGNNVRFDRDSDKNYGFSIRCVENSK